MDFDVLVPRFAAAGVRRFAFISLRDLPLSVPDRPGGVTLRQITPVLFEIEPTSE